MLKAQTIITVKEWFFDKLYDQMLDYNRLINGEYTEVDGIRMMSHTKLRIEDVLAETEKAYKVVIDACNLREDYTGWTTWIPKSVIVECYGGNEHEDQQYEILDV